jgi:hypothetical protein
MVDADYIQPLNLSCPEVEFNYSGDRISEQRSGASATCWFNHVYDRYYTANPGTLRVVMVNAFDAGFEFAHIDAAHSSNIAAVDVADNVVTGLYSQPSFFHVGHLAANNISPADRRGWIHMMRPRASTRISVDLWRKRPVTISASPDFVYEVNVEGVP